MPTLINQSMAAILELPFDKPRQHDMASVRRFADAVLDRYSQFGLKPAQVWHRQGDGVFDYETTASLFKGQALLKLNAERLGFAIENLRTNAEIDVGRKCGAQAIACAESSPDQLLTLQVNLHATFTDEGGADAFFATWSNPSEGVVDGGRIAQVAVPNLREPVRFLVERSLAFSNAAFLSLGVRRRGPADPAILGELVEAAARAVKRMSLEVTFS